MQLLAATNNNQVSASFRLGKLQNFNPLKLGWMYRLGKPIIPASIIMFILIKLRPPTQ
jgi:hypothetical protein